jgi:hypothetical protein
MLYYLNIQPRDGYGFSESVFANIGSHERIDYCLRISIGIESHIEQNFKFDIFFHNIKAINAIARFKQQLRMKLACKLSSTLESAEYVHSKEDVGHAYAAIQSEINILLQKLSDETMRIISEVNIDNAHPDPERLTSILNQHKVFVENICKQVSDAPSKSYLSENKERSTATQYVDYIKAMRTGLTTHKPDEKKKENECSSVKPLDRNFKNL